MLPLSSPPLEAPSRGSTAGDTSQRGVVLQGAAAHAWFEGQGFTVVRGQFNVVSDGLAEASFRAARVWHTAGAMRSMVERTRPVVLLQLEGTTALTMASGTYLLRPGTLALVPRGTTLVLDSDTSVARIELEVSQIPLTATSSATLAREPVLDASDLASASVLVSCVNTVLNGALETDDAGFASLRLAFANLAAAAFADAVARDDRRRPSRKEEVYQNARMVIAREASDPDFSVARLARELNISQQYIRSVFSDHRTTAREQIRALRASLARQHLEEAPGRRSATAAEAARLSGFRDVETMRRALRASEEIGGDQLRAE